MENNVKDIAHKISKLSTEEIESLSVILRDKYGIYSNIYNYPLGIISIDKQLYDVKLKNAGSQKLRVLKTIKEIFGLGLKEAKDVIDSAPCYLIKDISYEHAENLKYDLEELGAEIEIN